MLNSPFGGFPVPENSDADNVPAWATALVADLDIQTVLRATNATDRDTKFVNAPVSVVCVSTTDQTVWIKTSGAGTNNWETIWQKPNAQPYWSTGYSWNPVFPQWSDLANVQTQYGNLAFHYDRFKDEVSIRGGVVKSTAWVGQGEGFVRVPPGMEPVNTQGFVAFAVFSHATANCEVRADGWMYLWGWAGTSYNGLTPGGANTGIALDMIKYRRGSLS